jgi:hypothetical protein
LTENEEFEIRNCARRELNRLYFREGAAVVAGEGVGLASVCQPLVVGTASLRSKLLSPRSSSRLTVSKASKPGRASLVTEELKPSPTLKGVAELV